MAVDDDADAIVAGDSGIAMPHVRLSARGALASPVGCQSAHVDRLTVDRLRARRQNRGGCDACRDARHCLPHLISLIRRPFPPSVALRAEKVNRSGGPPCAAADALKE